VHSRPESLGLDKRSQLVCGSRFSRRQTTFRFRGRFNRRIMEPYPPPRIMRRERRHYHDAKWATIR